MAEECLKARSSPAYLEHQERITSQLNLRLSKVTGLPVQELGKNKFDCMFVSLCHGDPVPDGVDMGLMQQLEQEVDR